MLAVLSLWCAARARDVAPRSSLALAAMTLLASVLLAVGMAFAIPREPSWTLTFAGLVGCAGVAALLSFRLARLLPRRALPLLTSAIWAAYAVLFAMIGLS